VAGHVPGAGTCARRSCSPSWPPRWPTARGMCRGSVQLCRGSAGTRSGPVASTTTLWRLVDERIDAARLARGSGRRERTRAGASAWAQGCPGPRWLAAHRCEATITSIIPDHKENAAAGPEAHLRLSLALLMFWSRPTIAAPGERGPWPGLCCGRATQAVTPPPITAPCWARPLDSLPPQYRPGPETRHAPQIHDPLPTPPDHQWVQPPRAATQGWEFSLGGARSTAAIRARSGVKHPSTPPMGGIRRCRPTAASATAPGWPSHRSGGHVEMAAGDPTDPAARSPARITAAQPVHRCTTGTGVITGFSRHPQRRARGPACRPWSVCAIANTPAWSDRSAKPRPPG